MCYLFRRVDRCTQVLLLLISSAALAISCAIFLESGMIINETCTPSHCEQNKLVVHAILMLISLSECEYSLIRPGFVVRLRVQRVRKPKRVSTALFFLLQTFFFQITITSISFEVYLRYQNKKFNCELWNLQSFSLQFFSLSYSTSFYIANICFFHHFYPS